MNLIPKSFFFDDDFENLFLASKGRNHLLCDVYEKDDTYYLDIDVPGFNKEDINIEIKEGYLTVTAEKTETKTEEDKNYMRRERSYGSYSRTFNLGDADEDKIDAKFENGTLSITIPKKDESLTKKNIEIK